MNVSRVTVLAPIKPRIDPNEGTVSAMNNKKNTVSVRNKHLFQLKSVGMLSICSMIWAGGFMMMGKVVMRWMSNMISTTAFSQPSDMDMTTLSVTMSPSE